VIDKGLIGKRNESVELFRVKDVEVRKSLKQRARGVGDVVILSVDAMAPQVILESVSKPEALADIVRQHVAEARRRANVYAREGI
jgi:hypothetical protein